LFVIGAVLALAIAGAIIGANVIGTGDTSALQPPAYGINDNVPTSFGVLAVKDVSLLAGLNAEDLGFVTHGVGDLVPPDKEQAEISLILTNTTGKAVSYSFVDEFRVVTSSGVEADRLSGLSAPVGKLSGHSSLTTQLRFMTARDGGALILEYHEAGVRHTSRILVGVTDQAPEGVLDGYHDHSSAP
jgi:hypothetical protein